MNRKINLILFVLIMSSCSQKESLSEGNNKLSEPLPSDIETPFPELTSYFEQDKPIWKNLEGEEFESVVVDREEWEESDILFNSQKILNLASGELIEAFDLDLISDRGNSKFYSSESFRMVLDGEKIAIMRFDDLTGLKLKGVAASELTLGRFKESFPKAYHVRGFGTDDSNLFDSFVDNPPKSYDHTFIYLEDKGEVHFRWVDGILVEVTIDLNRQQGRG